MHNRRMALEFTTSYLKDAADNFRHYKRLAERFFAQVPDEALTFAPDPGSNSIATLAKHLSGNMRSRWRDFLTTDGEKPDRDRDSEFETPPKTRAELMEMWEGGWKYLFEPLEPLTEADLTRTVTIRSSPHSVMQAINRPVAHYAHHVGQIVMLAKHFATKAGKKWETLSVPRGQSKQFTAEVATGKRAER